ncbi:hypothetical protein HAX54_043048 [Datura stramonium]|uniref:Uncharacterized protein n=1 Tax=Datura stramonium TaxID=4076 RepID=A0ABS8W0C2_DATST|nr:hypothetical protein [Datura stramonium]
MRPPALGTMISRCPLAAAGLGKGTGGTELEEMDSSNRLNGGKDDLWCDLMTHQVDHWLDKIERKVEFLVGMTRGHNESSF